MRMRIAISGASGFVGQQLVPVLRGKGVDLLLISREPAKLRDLFPECSSFGVSQVSLRGQGCDLLVHFSGRNNNQAGGQDDFDAANVAFALQVLRHARSAGIRRFIYVSSVHALDPSNCSAYAESKRRGATALLEAAEDVEVSILYLPVVHSDAFAGKLAVLNHLPLRLRGAAFQVLASLRPTVSIDRIAAFLASGAPAGNGERLILSNAQMGCIVYAAVMRLVDYAFALTVILFFWWVLLAAWLAIKCETRGPGFFGQTRIGRLGRSFTCWKLRTMHVGTAQVGTHEVAASAVTRVGAFLRRTRIDELPQVWNILRGEMALIGPRPCLPVQTQLIQERQARGILSILPGISGLAQVEEIDMRDPVVLARREAEYLMLRGILLDIRLVLRTAGLVSRAGL